ncbi:hypothetical protein PHLCEN_2v13348 [Hermanssonia centrifuga]|uniref:Uncharacterized protein n=1 Tax=Hermanssonia centrifuga TaxID=98765 RepID=A0A2R6NEL6_9APHY|nr:hypothetical protein PHLCEN_2v13348 [Hermanssonia centrifuga]
MARVDPHLIFACEVILDVDGPLLRSMRTVQHSYIRRRLGLNKRSSTAVLFTETRLWPIRYRRVYLALQYLAYILRESPELALLALHELVALCAEGKSSLMGDLNHSLRRLPVPVIMEEETALTVPNVQILLNLVEKSMWEHLEEQVESSPKFVLLHGRLEYIQKQRSMEHRTLAFRDYLQVVVPDHRKALARLVCSDHPLAIEQLRRTAARNHIPRMSRTCRFCRIPGTVESEQHALIDCSNDELVSLCESFMTKAIQAVPAIARQRRELSSISFLRALLSWTRVTELLGKYTHRIFRLCTLTPLLIHNDFVIDGEGND